MNRRLVLFIIVMTILLALPRFAHHTPDSAHYVALAKFFRGEVTRDSLRAPFVYRVLLPLLASYGPASALSVRFATINVMCTIMAYIVFFYYLEALFGDSTVASLGIFLLVFSFPTINYASGVLTDPGGFFFFVSATYALSKKRFLAFSALATMGVLVREANLMTVLMLVVYSVVTLFRTQIVSTKNLFLLAFGIPPLLSYLLIRLLLSEFEYSWQPSVAILLNNVTRPISWATVLPTILPLAVISVAGLAGRRRQDRPKVAHKLSDHARDVLLSTTIAAGSLAIHSILSAFMSGRFLWSLYTGLIPFSLIPFSQTSIYTERLTPLLIRIFRLDVAQHPVVADTRCAR